MATAHKTDSKINSPRGREFAGAGLEWKLHWLLTVGVVMEFVGHGACGVATKAGWLPFFRVFAFPDSLSWKLMPIIGSLDICLGILAILTPRRALYAYMALWGCFTALLRPASGQGWWEFIERSYNYGVPLALLFLHRFGTNWKTWFAPVRDIPKLTDENFGTLLVIFRVIIALMLIGHGGYGPFMAKANLLGFYQATGIGAFGVPMETVRAGVGFFEMALGVAALFAVSPGFFVGICAWKIFEESLHLVAGAPLACWEVTERGGSYVAPLAALLALQAVSRARESFGRSQPVILEKALSSQ